MSDRFELVVPTLFGLESLVAKELYRIGYDSKKVENGRVTLDGDYEAICRTNLWLRCGERVLIKLGEFPAKTADELYDGVRAIEWERFIGRNSAFPVKGRTIRSVLASDRNSQIIIKKAIADRLGDVYGLVRMPETAETYQVQFTIIDNVATLMIDTTGPALHKRGYRRMSNLAPLRETIAAAMVILSFWKFEYPLSDPFCGSGTIPIEAAMFKRNIAPGLNRRFAYENFVWMDERVIKDAYEEARDEIHRDVIPEIFASDIDKNALELTGINAKIAGVGEYIKTDLRDARNIRFDAPFGTIITNPPYGERLSDFEECKRLYAQLGKTFSRLDRWSYYILSSHGEFEKEFGRRADRRRKVYNGMLRCNIYQYYSKFKSKKSEDQG